MGLFDYDNASLAAEYRYRVSERDEAFGRVGASRFRVRDLATRTDSVSVLVGWARDLHERTSASVAGGLVHSRFERPDFVGPPPDDVSGALAETTLTHEFETGSVEASLGRSLLPTGDGFLVQRDRLEIVAVHRLAPRWRLRGHLFAYRNDSLGEDNRAAKVSYGRASLALVHDLDREWLLHAEVAHSRRENRATDRQAHANLVLLQLVYTPMPWSVSR